jgi:hypothetical protein
MISAPPWLPPRSWRRDGCCGDDLTSIGEAFIFQMLEPSPHLPQEVNLSGWLEGRQAPAGHSQCAVQGYELLQPRPVQPWDRPCFCAMKAGLVKQCF